MKRVILTEQQRNLAWRLNWYRQSELEGALLLGKMVGATDDGEIAAKLTKHCADEARHAQLWAETIAGLDLPHVRIFRSYQSFYLAHGGAPMRLLEVLAFTQVFERRVHKRFLQELRDSGTPDLARAAYRTMIEDEKEHLGWVAEWLQGQSDAGAALKHFQETDRAVFAELQPFEERIWEIPNLGREAA